MRHIPGQQYPKAEVWSVYSDPNWWPWGQSRLQSLVCRSLIWFESTNHWQHQNFGFMKNFNFKKNHSWPKMWWTYRFMRDVLPTPMSPFVDQNIWSQFNARDPRYVLSFVKYYRMTLNLFSRKIYLTRIQNMSRVSWIRLYAEFLFLTVPITRTLNKYSTISF